MTETRILIVEDSRIIALNLQRSLEELGYQVCGSVPSGEEAIVRAGESRPSLILMDIILQGQLDGIDTAGQIKLLYDIPVVYLSAQYDDTTLARAKVTQPFGYLVKPFEERVLHTTIELALYQYALEKRLQENEEWLATTLQSIGDGVIATDAAGNIRLLNPIAEKLTGWPQAEAAGKKFSEVFQTLVPECGMTDDQTRGKAGSTRCVLLTRQNGRIPIDHTMAPILDLRGGNAGAVVVFRDITERWQAEEILRQSEERYRAVVEQAVEGIYLADAETRRIIETNGSFRLMLGYSDESLIGTSLRQLIVQPEPAPAMAIRPPLDPPVPAVKEQLYLRKDGTAIELETSSSLITYGGREILCTVVRDITQRKEAENALRKNAAKIRALLNAIPDLMLRIDGRGIILEVKAAKNIEADISDSTCVGKPLREFFPAELAAQMMDHVLWAITFDEPQTFEYQIAIGGVLHSREARIFPSGEGEVIQIIRDFTERKQMEEQLRFLSFHDALTGLHNRTYFEDEMARLKNNAATSFGIILCDVDGLKLVNDTLGHEKGDQLLQRTAQTLADQVGSHGNGFAARIGGDEFAILLSPTSQQEISQIWDGIRLEVQAYNDSHPDLPLSISLGYAISRKPSDWPRSIFKEADDHMYREKLYRSQSTRSIIVQALMKMLETKDFVTEGHVNRMQLFIANLAAKIGLAEPSVISLRLLAQFHDIGKVGTPDRVLFKAGPLDAAEKLEMQRHSEIGHRIAQSILDLQPIADLILKHHEWWNGTGYPLGLREEEIPMECRVLAIADAYDAMTSDRPYRKAMTKADAFRELKNGAGSQFDPKLVDKFLEILGA